MRVPVERVVGGWRRLLTYWLMTLLAWQPLLPALAAGVSVAAGNTQTLQAGNGVPVVNIATPNQAGLSHNQYQQFNVGGEGLILNNATDKLTQSQLGGLIRNNPNLQAGREAKSIINEVVGANRSQLQGYLEVAGKAANVIVANPYGITCNGCGFINTPNATLTTGKPILAADGSLQALEVTQGDIIVEGRGLDAGQSDAFSLLARATQINAGLYAKDLTVAVGNNRIDAAGNISALGNSNGTPRVAVDTGALGGMYANRIRLVSSDKGVGVNLGNLSAATGGIALSAAGDLTVNNAVAQGGTSGTGDLALSADGKLTVNNAVARGSLNASGNGVQLGGNVAAQHAMALASRSDLAVDHATLSAGDGLRLDAAGRLSANASTLSAGIDNAGNVGEQGTLWLKAAAISLSGSQGTAAGTQFTADGDLQLDAASQLQARQLTLSGQQLQLDGQLSSNRDLTINGAGLSGAGSAVFGSQQNINLNLSDASQWNGQMLAGTGLHFHGGSLTNGGQLLAVNELTFAGTGLDNGGRIQAGDLTLNADSLNNRGQIQAQHGASLTARALTQQTGAGLLVGDSLTVRADSADTAGSWQSQRLDYQGGDWHNRGTVSTLADMVLGLSGTLQNDGNLLAKDALSLSTTQLTNQGAVQGQTLVLQTDHLQNAGTLISPDRFDLRVTGALTNLASGRVLTDDALNISAGTLDNQGVMQGGTLTLNGGTVSNAGSLTGLDLLSVTATGTLDNGGKLLSNGNGTLAAGQFNHRGFAQAQQWHITADGLDNNGVLAGIGGLWLTLTGAAQNRAQGQLLSNGESQIHTTDFTNGGLWQAASLLLTANNATNQGRLQGSQQATLTLANAYTGANGSVLAGGDGTSLSAATINNAGTLQAKQLQLTTGSLTNDGTLQGTDLLDLQLSGDLTNNAGASLLGAGRLQVLAQHLTNRGMIQGGDVSLTGSTFDNGGTTQGNQSLGLTLTGPLNNLAGGQLLAGGLATLGASQFTNDGWLQAQQLVYSGNQLNNNGTLLANDRLQLTVPVMINQGTLQAGNATVNSTTLTNSGTLLGLTTLALQAAAIDNQNGGRIYSAQDLSFTTGSLQQNGRFLALGNLNGHITGGLDFSTQLAAGKLLTLRADGDFNQRGTLQGNGVQLIAGGTLTNSGQVVTGAGGLSIDAAALNLQSGGSLQSGGAVNLTSRNDINNQGFVGTLGGLVLQAANTLTNTGLLYSGGNMQLLANAIHNLRGDILAGNSLWMQRDANGNANGEIINTSGNIETQNGDINIATAHLLNQRDGFSVTQTNGTLAAPSWANGVTVLIPESWFKPGEIGVYHDVYSYGGAGEHGISHYADQYYFAPYPTADIQQVAVASTTFRLTSSGNAGRLVAGHDINAYAGSLENIASNVLAGNNINLHGNSLSNSSYQEGTTTQYQQYKYSTAGRYGGDTLMRPNQTLAEAPNYFRAPSSQESGYFNNGVVYTAVGAPIYAFTGGGQSYNALIQAGGAVNASFNQDISNTTVKPNIGGIDHQLSAPSLGAINTLAGQSAQSGRQLAASDGSGSFALADSALDPHGVGHGGALTPAELGAAIQNGLRPLSENPLADYPLPSGNNGLFVLNTQPGSHYLITTNPKLQQLGKVDGTVFNDLQGLLGQKPTTSVPVETDSQWTNPQQFLGSAYLLDKLNLKADYDYRFLGDAAFDTRYISNAMVSQTGQRYLNGVGSDLAQMQYLLDNAAAAQQSLNLQFGVSLTPEQVASLTHSIIWWEPINVDGNIVLAPKLYLDKADETNLQGSVISGQQVALSSGTNVTNSGAIQAVQLLDIASQGTITNQGGGLLKSDGSLDLTALNNISNLSSTVEGGSVRLTSLNGSIVNQTQSDTWSVGRVDKSRPWGPDQTALSATETGNTAAINASGNLVMSAGKDISIIGATLKAGGSAALNAGNNVIIAALAQTQTRATSTWDNSTTSEQTGALASAINAGGALNVNAGNDLTVTGSSLTSGGGMALAAGNDINLLASANGTNQTSDNGQSHTSSGAISSLSSGGDLSVRAGRDVTTEGTALAAVDSVAVSAGRDINLDALQSDTYSANHGSRSRQEDESIRQQGTALTAGSDIRLNAGQDINLFATQAQAGGAIGVTAGRDINLDTARESDYHFAEKTDVSSGLFSSTTTHTVEQDYATLEKGSLLSGNSVNLSAGNNIGITGSSVIADDHVTLQAGNNIDITAATEEQSSYRLKEKKTSGMFSGGGFGVTFGSKSMRQEINQDGTTQSQSVSTLGATDGNVNIIAGGKAHLSDAQVIAGNNLNVVAGEITIDQGNDLLKRRESYEQKQSGLTLALHSPVTDALLTLGSLVNQAGETSDNRMKALYAVEAIHTGWAASQNKDALKQAAELANGDYSGSVKLELSVGASKSSYLNTLAQKQAQGSTLTAGNNVNLVATGGNNQSGDLHITGSGVTGKNVTLSANRDLILDAADSTTQQKTDSNSSGWNVGVHISVGSETGIGVSANGYMATDKSTGSNTDYLNSRINAQDQLSLTSGRDTVLNGAQALGNQIVADVGRDLTITSLQDLEDYQRAQKSVSGGFSFTFGSMTGSASLSMSSSKTDSQYASVGAQSGLFAGDGGYDITVGNHTQLNGAVIASTADATNNLLSTDTLGWSEIKNNADYRASGYSLSGGVSHDDKTGETTALMVPGLSGSQSGSAAGTTGSAIAGGSLIIRDQANQQQDVTTLSHDTADANGHIDKIFDKEKVERDLVFTQAVGRVSTEVVQDALQYQLKSAKDAARDDLAKNSPSFNSASADEQEKRVEASPAYQAAQEKYGIGSPYAMAGAAISGALAGLAGGDLSQVAAGGLAPYLALAVKTATTDENGKVNVAANTLGHALAGGLVAYLQGNSAAAGAAGSAGGELAAQAIMAELYPNKTVSELTEEQKQTISALSSMAAGLAGAVAGNSGAGGAVGVAAGKNAVENNLLLQMMASTSATSGALAAGQTQTNATATANKVIAQKLDEAVNQFGKSVVRQCLSGGDCPIAVSVALSAITSLMSNGTEKENQQPNLGKDDGAKEIAGGGGNSATPGGWGPDDETNTRNNESTGNASNRADFEKYLDTLRTQMNKPNVQDDTLNNIINDLYRPNAKIGNGSTADAVRYELSTGEKVGGKSHIEKAESYSKALTDWLNDNPQASANDKSAAENVLKDMQNALRGK